MIDDDDNDDDLGAPCPPSLVIMGFTFSGYSIHKWEGFSDRDEESEVAFGRPNFTLRYPWDSVFLLLFLLVFFCPLHFPGSGSPRLNWLVLAYPLFFPPPVQFPFVHV
jgi:hypothetical protein